MSLDTARNTQDLEQLFSLSVDLMCIANFEGYFLRLNPSFSRVLGYDLETLQARPFLDFVHPDDRGPTAREIASLSEGATTIDFENRYRCADGSYRCLAWHARPMIAQQRIFAVARDVTEQRAHAAALVDREAQLRAVFGGAVDAMILVDDDGVIESCNPALLAMFGYELDALLGRRFSTLMPDTLGRGGPGRLERSLGASRILGGGPREVAGLRADGATIPIELGVSEIKLSDRRIYLGILRDISERKRVESENAARLAREARDRGRMEFSAQILHDLGNVLTSVGSSVAEVRAALSHAEIDNELPRTARFVRTMRTELSSALGASRADALGDILEGVERAMSTAQSELREGLAKLSTAVDHAKELLDVHRAQSQLGGERSARVATVDEAMSSVQAMVSVDLASRGGRFDLDVSPAARAQRVDALLLVRALVNGARNSLDAFDAAPLGAPPRISLRVELDDEARLLFVLVDNGPGFEGSGEDLFEDGRTTRARGSGLGLGSARRVVESLGGRVSLTSPGPGRGAKFAISLPVWEEVTP